MKKFILMMCIALTAAACASQHSKDAWVKVEGNRFIGPDGNEIVFRGLCFSDPVKLFHEGQWTERYFAEAADWGANVVRFALHPTHLNSMGWDATFEIMDQGIEWAEQYGMYVIMDWHSIGNLKDAKFTNPMYVTDLEETLRFWSTAAERYKDEPTVALYEIFNEPTVTGEDTGECTWEEWKAIQEQIIDTIRAHNPNAVCLCAGFNWAYDLTQVAEAPVERPNVAYVSHPYPMKREQPWEEQWEADFGYVADTYPVICTEIGFCLENEKGAHIPVISTEEYGRHITEYFEKKGISFTVWCFDKDWAPTLIDDWDFTPSTQGRFFKDYLQSKAGTKPELKPRIVVLTDIAPGNIEPDDMESMVRLMTYADQYEIEALITTTGWNCDPYPTSWADSLHRVIDAYEADVNNLMKRSQQEKFVSVAEEQGRQRLGYWPSPEYLRSRVAMGSQRSGIGVIGADNNTAGSELIISLVDEYDDRPLWITCWGGGNTLAQAIWKVQQERTPEQLKAFLNKLRVYTITDQDMVWAMRFDRAYSSHQWMRREFADDLLFIWDESAWLSQNELGSASWDKYAERIQGRGNLGKAYPTYKWGVEGDTPSFLNVMPNGLHDPSCPEQIGWAGCFRRGLCPDSLTTAWTNCDQPMKGISRAYEERFYPDTFNDFAARMDWAAEGEGNRNPVIVLNGNVSYMPEYIKASAGASIKADVSMSHDPDGDDLQISWWTQKDAGTYGADIDVKTKNGVSYINIPDDAAGTEIHVICEARDNGIPALTSYRRIVISVQ